MRWVAVLIARQGPTARNSWASREVPSTKTTTRRLHGVIFPNQVKGRLNFTVDLDCAVAFLPARKFEPSPYPRRLPVDEQFAAVQIPRWIAAAATVVVVAPDGFSEETRRAAPELYA